MYFCRKRVPNLTRYFLLTWLGIVFLLGVQGFYLPDIVDRWLFLGAMLLFMTGMFIILHHKHQIQVTQLETKIKKYKETSHKNDKNLFEELPVAIIVVNEVGEIIKINSYARRISGISKEEYRINVLQRTNAIDTPLYFLAQTLRGEEEFHEQYYNYQGEQELSYLYVNTSKMVDCQGKTVGAILIACQVSEQSFLGRHLSQRGKLALIGELAAGTAHEIRNPLTTVKGLIQLIAQRFPQGDRARQHFDVIMKEIEQINSIIKELLLLARRTTPNLSFASLPAVLDQVLLLIEGEANCRGIQIIRDYNDQLPLVIIDEDQIKQVFIHLATNAIHAMPSGGELHISARTHDISNALEISFADTGIGIKKEHLARIFQPFFTTTPENTGLGLPVSYQIIDNHGGNLSVRSQLGKGSTFSVTLPLVNY
ncbi:signal transduction histidine kinase, nitrogen specific, NtrB [Desulforamulus reducens MI-1]|uniref:histidine kinase n=2 Tax=Desulforamulus TaxID=2916693 RepID=A4J5B7_DESRM|nr:signal transduction histidine kinase, nitrogen specific, NtrB [Desulforamulus reducens MI-1]